MKTPRQELSFRRILQLRALPLFATLIILCGCSGRTVTVEIPPKVDLRTWPVIGVIDFTCDTNGELAPAATQKFLMHLQSAQPGVRLLELGNRAEILRAVSRETLDPETIRSIGKKYGVEAILWGNLEISEVKPDINISPDLKSLSAKASVGGELSAKLQETSTGATIWTNGAHGKWAVAGMNLSSGGLSNIGLSSPGDRYDQMLRDLTLVATNDFRPRYEKHRVKD